MSFGTRLTEARKKKQLTQEGLGKGLGTDGKDASKAVVYGWEKDQHFPRVDQLVLICEKLGTSADYLLFGRVAATDLTPEVADIASSIDRMPSRQREWTLRNVKDILHVSNETFGLAQMDEAVDPTQESLKRQA